MTAQEFAALLAGATHRNEVSREHEALARANGLVIVFGASDDLMEFRGAVRNELDAYDGTTAYLTPAGLLQNECEDENCPHFEKLKKNAATVDALWSAEPDYSWTFKTEIPHATFEITEDGEPYCRGIVFAMADAVKRERDTRTIDMFEERTGKAA